jgi:hypothetical protein
MPPQSWEQSNLFEKDREYKPVASLKFQPRRRPVSWLLKSRDLVVWPCRLALGSIGEWNGVFRDLALPLAGFPGKHPRIEFRRLPARSTQRLPLIMLGVLGESTNLPAVVRLDAG